MEALQGSAATENAGPTKSPRISHTLGPWRVEDHGVSHSLTIVAGPRARCAVQIGSAWCRNPFSSNPEVLPEQPQQEANARLIAAAPDMHELLTKMRGHLHAQWNAEIDAVLAKAEGK